MHRYYYLLRPPGPMCQPRGFSAFEDFPEGRRHVHEIGREAWGWVDYDRELSEDEQAAYDLIAAKNSRNSR